ncbi:hypothetical protein RI129_004745 [Pyrocoelia pectoralis]|uniref:C2H2-type domain-containing protein n=1 Tax=Pyrocoelia pectoralis TaxID=417401 RepID=A0AAN7ZRA1_9COLE
MVNSGSFDSDVDRNEKDGFTQLNHIVESPQSVVSIHAVSGTLCENDFTTQTADSLPVSQAIEPTATKTEFKCNMSEEFVCVRDNFVQKRDVEGTRDSIKETHVVDDGGKTELQPKFVSDEQYVDQVMSMGYLKKYKIERKPSICCSVPLNRIPDVLKVCNSLIAAKTPIADYEIKKDVMKKELCLYCDRTFIIPAMKQKHMNRFHSLNKYRNLRKYLTKCWFCDMNTETRDLKQLFSHLVTDHSEKYFGCLECEIRFPTFQLMESHKSSMHSNALPLRVKAQPLNTSEETLKTGTHDDTTKTPTVKNSTESPLAKTKTENRRNIKADNQNSLNNLNSEQVTVKTRRKCQSKYLSNNKSGNLNSRLPDSSEDDSKTNNKIKSKTKLVKELRNKKLSVISTKMGMKHCLRITRQRSKILENAKNSKKRITQKPTQKSQSNLTTKYITYPNSCSPYDISYRVKKITDHSIDNLRISSLTFDDVFDKAFFNRVKCNIQENLLNFIDGKLFKSVESEYRISSFQKKEDLTPEEANANCGYAMTSTPVVLIEANIIDDMESQVDTGSKSKKKTIEIVPCKYFTRRKYQAVISERKGNKDLSKLDMWTQLVVKNRQQKILSDQKTDKELVEYKKSDEYKVKMQLEELNGILDKRGPLEDLKEEVMRTVALEKINSVPVESNMESYLDVTMILNDLLNNLFPKETSSTDLPLSDNVINKEVVPDNRAQDEQMFAMFNLQRISNLSQTKTVENVVESEAATVELTGEWARTRIYVCGACGLKLPNAKLLVDHKNLFHVNVWCQHYEFVGNQGELYRHLSIPVLGKIGAIEDKLVNDIWRKSDARVCSKCNKRFNCLGDLHRHMLECGGDLAWMLERKKYKYRPYGSKTRKKRRGLLRLLQAFRNQTREKRKKTIKKFSGPRQKPSDADTIQRMLANLPAKRTTRKVISLKDGFSRSVLTKKMVNTNTQPLKKEVKNVINTSVKNIKKNSNINRTRRLLRSNSSILLENNLILPKFKRKKNENLNIIKRCSLRTNKNLPKKFLTNNPIVSTCKLPDELIKSFTQNEPRPLESDRVSSISSDNSISEDQVEDEKIHQDKDNNLHDKSVIKDHEKNQDSIHLNGILNSSTTENSTVSKEEDSSSNLSVVKLQVRKKKKTTFLKSKVTNERVSETRENNINSTHSEIESKQKMAMSHEANTNDIRKLRFRNRKNVQVVPSKNFPPKIKKKMKSNIAKKNVIEIIQVDGSSQSKTISKNNDSKRECNTSPIVCNKDIVVTVNNINTSMQNGIIDPNNKDNTSSPQPFNSDEEAKLAEDKTMLEISNHEDINNEPCEDKLPLNNILPSEEAKMDELVPVPQTSKRIIKKLRGLNDCIAMLTNKLHDKHLDSNGSNALEHFCSKTVQMADILLNKVNDAKPEPVLNLQVEQENVCTDTILESNMVNNLNLLRQDEECEEPPPLLQEVGSLSNLIIQDHSIETNVKDCNKVEKTNHSDTQRSVLTESILYEDFDSCISVKPKVKHKRRKTRKKELKTVPDKLVTTNDKLQEIPAENNDFIFNGTKHNSDFNVNCSIENQLNLEKEQGSIDSDKFSNSEKENTLNDHSHKVPKTKKSRRKFERVVQVTHPTQVESPISIVDSHIIDIINAVATNEVADSEDELPLSQLIKRYVSDANVSEPVNQNEGNSTLVFEDQHEIITMADSISLKSLESETMNSSSIVSEDIVKPKRHSKRQKRKNVQNTFVEEVPLNSVQNNSICILQEISDSFGESTDKIPTPEVADLASPTNSDDLVSKDAVNEGQEALIVNNILLENGTATLLDSDQDRQQSNNIPKVCGPKSKVPFKRKYKKIVRKAKVKTPTLRSKLTNDTVNLENIFCDICNKTFRRSENLFKHKRTLTHIAKLSELEALECAKNSKEKDDRDIVPVEEFNTSVGVEEQVSFQNIESDAYDDYPQSDVSATFSLGSPQEGLKLVDIINDVLSKPVDTEYVEHRNFSNLVLQSDPEVKRCKSLGERKSFDCDKLQIVDTTPMPSLEDDFEEAKISNTAADIIVEKQISLLENMIEDNRNTMKSSEKMFVPSELPITDEYSCQSNSSTFSILSNNKPEDLNEIRFTHNTNIIANLIKPPLDDHVIPSTQYEQISDDSNSSHFPVEEQKSRKALNRDEELFLECCSLLKSSSDVSDLCRKSVKSTKFLNNFGFKPLDELEWMEQKQLPIPNTLLDHTSTNPLNLTHSNTPICETFYSDVTFSNTDNSNSKMFLEKSDNNFFSQPPIFEDISTESDDSSRKSLTNSQSVAVASIEYNSNINFNNEDRSSPNVESAQIPCEDDDHVEVQCVNEQMIENIEQVEESNLQNESEDTFIPIQDEEKPPSPTPLKLCSIKKIKKHEHKKFVTKGALKVFEGLKVSIPKVELDMKEVLSCSPTSKRLEIEAEQDKISEQKSHTKKDSINKNFIFNKFIKNGKKVNNKLGLKVTKKRYNIEDGKNYLNSKITKINDDQKSHDIYDFEETQDSVDMFIKNSDSLPDYHSFKNKITSKLGFTDDIDDDLFSKLSKNKDETKKVKHNANDNPNNSNEPPSRKLKMNKTITKKKCMIMGRIFKNALKSKVAEEMKNIPAIDNSKIVENFVMDCHNLQQNTDQEKHKLSEEEMNLLFDSLLNEDNCNSVSKENVKNDHATEIETSKVKSIDARPRQKINRQRKRQRGHSSESSDEEFSLKKFSKKQISRKSNSNDCVINLEQELKECIGVASRKSQRKCTSGKQNVLVEYWSSDESNFDYERTVMLDTFNSDTNTTLENVQVINPPVTKIMTSSICNVIEKHDINDVHDLRVDEDADDKSKEMKKRCFKTKHFKKKNVITTDRTINGEEHNHIEHDSETIASTRQKRNAADTLYYWSSSSEDEMQDVIEVKPIREDCEDEDRPAQQGWIVGDSPKKLVTMLAQAKGKKLDVEYVKKNRKKRTTL